ncbi:MAG TPA: ABC transporter permease [Gemmatimonadaceae bacterium]|nr:ABC transporter permease [Gemmatimonadaceae bacterium]
MKRFFRFPRRTARRIADEAESEFRFHIDARTDRLVVQGMSPAAARAQAIAEFGDMDDARRYVNNVDRQAEARRRRRDYMGELAQDLAYAVRKLKNAPTFTISVVLTLAIGIGANTAVLNLMNAVLLKPPPVANVDELSWLTPRTRDGQWGAWSMPDVMMFREQTTSWAALSAMANITLTLNDGEPARIAGYAVNGNFFELVGVRPSPGRGFFAYEDTIGTPSPAVVLSHAFWSRRFGGDSSVVGTEITLNGAHVRVVGVTPEWYTGVRLGDAPDFWIPFAAVPRLHIGRDGLYTAAQSRWLRVIGRLSPRASLAQAQAEAAVVQGRLEAWITDPARRRTIDVSRIRSGVEPGARERLAPVFALISLVPVLVLVVACANVANLFISRSVVRQRELAVRRAIGASRGRLVRQLLTECAILGVIAGAVGVAMSYALTGVIVRVGTLPPDLVAILRPDGRVFLITFGIALSAGTLFGLLPALAATRSEITPALRNDGTALAPGRGRHRLRNAFVVSQVAISLALLITAGLFVGSLRKALTVDPGYDPHNTVAAEYNLSGQGYTNERIARFDTELEAVAAAQPGVEAAAVAELLPLSGSSSSTNVRRESDAPDADGILTLEYRVTSAYFATIRMPVTQGRTFTATDNASSPRVAVVNERLASILWPGENPLGKRIRSPHDSTLVTVVGVAANGKYRSLAEAQQLSAMWLPSAQFPMGAQGELIVRARAGTADAVAAARAALKAMDPTLPVASMRTLDDYIANTVSAQRAGAAMLAVFGAVALALAAFGIFAVIAQGVAARRREIGIRMSLGARTTDVVRAFVREGLVLTAIGTVVGVALSLAVSKLLASLLFGLTATDALTFASATIALVAVAALAAFLPARRAARVDPLIALRSD